MDIPALKLDMSGSTVQLNSITGVPVSSFVSHNVGVEKTEEKKSDVSIISCLEQDQTNQKVLESFAEQQQIGF
jgi:hypothetical protein